jgi:hypothetical protein
MDLRPINSEMTKRSYGNYEPVILRLEVNYLCGIIIIIIGSTLGFNEINHKFSKYL